MRTSSVACEKLPVSPHLSIWHFRRDQPAELTDHAKQQGEESQSESRDMAEKRVCNGDRYDQSGQKNGERFPDGASESNAQSSVQNTSCCVEHRKFID